MAKKKQEEQAPAGSPAWMATFSDLMNLLLCFFVLLYSMSSIDSHKYDIIRASLSNTMSIFESGMSFFTETSVVETGTSQIKDLEQYEEDSEETGETDGTEDEKSDIMEELTEKKKYYSSMMYDEISEILEDKNVSSDKVAVSIDPDYNYVSMTISGSILFDSGSAAIKEKAFPILSKVGDVLKVYDNYLIEIEGHTDNVPITVSKEYNDNLWLSTARALNAVNYLIKEKNLNPSTIKSSGRGEFEPIASNDTAEGRQKNRRVEIKIYNQLSSY